MKGCGFGKVGGDEFLRAWIEEFRKLSLEDQERILQRGNNRKVWTAALHQERDLKAVVKR